MISTGDSRGIEAWRSLLFANAGMRLNLALVDDLSLSASESDASAGPPAGLLHASRMTDLQAAVAAAIAAGYGAVDILLSTAGNDYPTGIPIEQSLANIADFYLAAKSMGVRKVHVIGIYPSMLVASLGGFDALQSINAGIRRMAELPAFADLAPIMPGLRMVNPSASAWTPIGGGTGAVGSTAVGAVTTDGTHDSTFGLVRRIPSYDEQFQRHFVRLDDSEVLNTFSGWTSATQTSRGNRLGAQGRTKALGGTNSATGGTVTGTPPAGWTLTGALNGLSITFSAVTSAALQQRFGMGSAPPVVRMAVSGTPTADTTLLLSRSASLTGTVTGRWRHELLAQADAISGLCGFGLTVNLAQAGKPLFGNVVQNGRAPGVAIYPADALQAETLLLGGIGWGSQGSAVSSLTADVYMRFKGSVAAGGAIDLAGVSVNQLLDIA